MAFKVLDAGTLRTIAKATVKTGGVSRALKTAKVWDGGALRLVATFAPPLSVSASPALVSGVQSSTSTITVNTGFTTAVVSGGTAPYTYSWAYLSGDGASANSPTSATTNFGASVPPFSTFFTTFQVTATDALGNTATATVSATFANNGGGGPPP